MDEMNSFAPGWVLAFGNIMLEELDAAIKNSGVEDSFLVYQCKEKFGQLKIHHNQPKNSEIDIICKKYEFLSRYICIRCGCLTPDAKLVLSTWIRPACQSCYIKTEHVDPENNDYVELTKDSNSEIPDKMIWEEFERYDEENQKAIYKKLEVDVSSTIDKIKEHWERRVKSGDHVVEQSTLDRTYTIEEIGKELENIIKEDFHDDDE
jgi:hypothetical protein